MCYNFGIIFLKIMNKQKLWIASVLLVVLALVFVVKKNTPDNLNTIKIGVMAPLTGDGASYGEPARNVFELAKDEINSSGGINGKNLEFVYEDSKCNGSAAVNAVQKLVNIEKVQFILGGLCSTESLAAIPVAAAAKVAMASSVSTSPKLAGISPYFFRTSPSDASQGQVDAQVAMQKGYKTVAVVQEQLDYPLGLYLAFDKNMKSLGGKTIVEAFPAGTTDFRSILTKLKAVNPDALFLDPADAPTGERILKNLKDLGWRPKIIINEVIAGDVVLLGNYKNILEGAIGAEFVARLDNPKFQHLLKAYKDKYGQELPYQSYAQNEYDLVYLLRDGLMQVGNNGQKLAAWSRTVKDWQGASGAITIKPDGDRDTAYSAEIVRNGKMQPYK